MTADPFPTPQEPDAPQEIELKFEIEPAGLLGVRSLPAFAANGPKPSTLTSTYWDTPDHDLARAGLTLRVRRDRAKRLQTIKTADGVGLLGRGEWEGEISGDAPDLTVVADTPLAEVLTRKLARKLIPLFTTRIRRTKRLLEHDGAVVEMSLDEGEVEAGDRRRPLLQLELELKSGDPRAVFDIARPLLDAAPLRLSFVTKAASGYALADPKGRSRKSPAAVLTGGQGPGLLMQAVLRSVLGELSRTIEQGLDAASPRAVHKTRVAARRLRAALAVARALGPDTARDAIEAEVRWLAGELNAARDLDVFVTETLGDAELNSERPEAAARLRASIDRARTTAYARADQALRSDRLRRLLFEATAWAANISPGEDEPDFADNALQDRWKRARKGAVSLGGDDADARHRFRIALKKLRYASEFFAPLYGTSAYDRDRFIRALKALQQSLGELNDVAVASHVAEQALSATPDTAAALYAGERIGLRRAAAATSLKAARKHWRRLESLGPFW